MLGFKIKLTNRRLAYGGIRYDYKVVTPTGVTFEDNRFMVPEFWDMRKIKINLLGFICVRPGDTDSEYFEDYTPEQMEWARSDACEQAASRIAEWDN